MAEKNALDWITFVLVVVGGINWGLVGLFQFNLVNMIFGSIMWLEKLVYILVGISALYMIYVMTKK
ncbi:DUF378 domain-containing protein [Candidatus Woesearchaeota archaeon]|nr:DUF378 domain-containing protein [Candidatus Woesearchaeota archaeon]